MEFDELLGKLKGSTVNLIFFDKDSGYSYNDIKEILSDNNAIIVSDIAAVKDNTAKRQREKILRETRLQREISWALKYIGMTPNIKGFIYIKSAVLCILESPEQAASITKIVYPSVAKKYNTAAACVERAIRHAIEKVFSREGTHEKICALMGYSVNFMKARPSNNELIALIADYIRTKSL